MISKHSVRLLLSPIILLAAMSSVHAELIDNSETRTMTEEQAKKYANEFDIKNASWRVKPDFLPAYIKRHLKTGVYRLSIKLIVDTEGNILHATIAKSSGNKYLDKFSLHQMRRAKFNPFIKDGKAVKGVIFIPLIYRIEGPKNADNGLAIPQ